MLGRNRDRFGVLYEKGESLFNELHEFQNTWRPFVILGYVNLEDLCDVYLKTRDDWDKNFKACKQFSQQIAKIPSAESRIDCFVINTSPIRSDIEFIGRKYWEVLTYSLRSSILKDITTLQDFLNTSLQVLQTVPAMEESYIEEAGEKCQRIIAEMPTVSLRYRHRLVGNPIYFHSVSISFQDVGNIEVGRSKGFMFGRLVS